MKEPRWQAGRGTDGYGKTLARQVDLEYLRDAANRDSFNEHEQIGLGWALFGIAYAKAHALNDDDRAKIERLQKTLESGRLQLSHFAKTRARELIEDALSGGLEARIRMLRWADREDI